MSEKEMKSIIRKVQTHARYFEVMELEVRVMARAEGYAMVRRKGAMPFVVSEKELITATRTPKETANHEVQKDSR